VNDNIWGVILSWTYADLLSKEIRLAGSHGGAGVRLRCQTSEICYQSRCVYVMVETARMRRTVAAK
jgi:hypothetical protein